MEHRTRLRDDVAGSSITPLIGVFDLLSASIAAQRFDGFFGFGFAASHYGLSDIGFIAWPDTVAIVQRLRCAFPTQHLLVDIDDGYVDPEVASHVVAQLERAGASGVILEDQQRPRRYGHIEGKRILPLEQYLEKLEVVLATRRDLVVVARTDAGEEDEIPRRAAALAETDADVSLVDGVGSVERIEQVRRIIGDKPLLFNQIAGGKSPRLSLPELETLGVDAAIYSTACLFAAQRAIEQSLLQLEYDDGRLSAEGVVVAGSPELLEKNISRHQLLEAARERDGLPVPGCRPRRGGATCRGRGATAAGPCRPSSARGPPARPRNAREPYGASLGSPPRGNQAGSVCTGDRGDGARCGGARATSSGDARVRRCFVLALRLAALGVRRRRGPSGFGTGHRGSAIAIGASGRGAVPWSPDRGSSISTRAPPSWRLAARTRP